MVPIAPRAFAAGYQARRDGQPRKSPNGTTNRAGWLQGYDAANTELTVRVELLPVRVKGFDKMFQIIGAAVKSST